MGPALLLATTAPALASDDILQLKDGRVVDGVTMELTETAIVVKYKNGDVTVPLDRVEDYFVGGRSRETGLTDEDKEKQASGLVRFRGRWITVAKRTQQLEKERRERHEALKDVQAHREWRNRYQFETKNFAIQSTLPPHINERYSQLLEDYFAEFKKMWGIRVPKKWGRLPVCFYHDRDSFNRTAGVSGGTAAYYRFVDPRDLNFYYDRTDPDQTVAVMFHEANHYLTDLMSETFQYPNWVNEAMAEYWAVTVWDADTGKVQIGGIQDGRLVEVKNDIEAGKRYGLRRLITNENREYEFYYWGWSFVHFMLETKKYEKGFRKFFVQLARGKGVKRSRGAFNFEYVSGDECLRVFLKNLKLKDGDLEALQTEWYAYIDQLESNGTRGLEEAGMSAFAHNRRLRAERLLKAAMEAGSTSISAHIRYAEILRMKPEGLAEAEKILRRAVEIDSLEARVWAHLGYTLWIGDRKEDGKRLANLAREIDPDNPFLLIDIAEALGEHLDDAR